MKKIKIRFIQLIIIIKSIYYYCYCNIKKINNDDVWLISERGDEARDNGYTFFKYLKENHPEIKSKYIISKTSKDRKKLKKYEKDIIIYRSKEHYIYFFTAGKLISTHIMGFAPDFRSFGKLDKKGILKAKGKRIFLQHGITKDYSEGLKKKNLNLDIFICGAKPEYEYLLKTLGFTSKELKYTGLSRYDYLEPIEDNIILLMPTWRQNLYYCSNDKSFIKTEYYKRYQELIENKNLQEYLKKSRNKLVFYPHYEIQEYIKCFYSNCENVIIANSSEYDVQDLLRRAKILITDYSSVFFDSAYMGKPVIYYQFDYDKYRSEHYKEGYFNYKKNGFGPVCSNLEEVIKYIDSYIKNDYIIEQEYQERIQSFFEYKDNNNSERIYKEINNIK